MANLTESGGPRPASRWRIAGWGMAAGILLIPFVAMQFTREVAWTVGDFLFAGLMIGTVGLAIELTFRATDNRAYRTGIGFAMAASFLTIWINGAVGMIGSEENPYNLIFLGVVVLGLLGSAAAGFHARGMAYAMTLAAAVQLGASTAGAMSDLRGGILSALLAAPWLMAGAMFRTAATDNPGAKG